MRTLELKVPPLAVVLLAGAAMWFVAGRSAPCQLSLTVRLGAFAVLALTGGAIALAGVLEFRRMRTTIDPLKPENSSALVTSGIYRFTRNPMYAGLALVLLAWAAFLCSFWALIGPAVFVLYIGRLQIAPEERALFAKFGAAYTEYAARVRRWL